VLDEIRWNLDWMLTMQDEDGGVWHKLTSERFGSFVMPDKDDGMPRFVIGTGAGPFKSSCATADFAAVTAIAARAYRTFDAGFADTALAASRRAWQWVSGNPAVRFRNPAGVQTGEYGDGDCSDERLWAAAELLRTTGEPAFEKDARALAGRFTVGSDTPQAWPNVGNLGLWSYALAERGGVDAGLQERIRQDTIAAARRIAERTRNAGWRHSLTTENFVWGSNGVAADYGVLLLVADRFSPAPELREAALENVHYLLGRNTFGVSWLTGVGVRPFRNPHHRPSGADRHEAPWPGLLSGGPAAKVNDPALSKLPPTPPGRRYVDDQESYASNENAINWNAALVFLLAGVQK
jgi:endoglucanase